MIGAIPTITTAVAIFALFDTIEIDATGLGDSVCFVRRRSVEVCIVTDHETLLRVFDHYVTSDVAARVVLVEIVGVKGHDLAFLDRTNDLDVVATVHGELFSFLIREERLWDVVVTHYQEHGRVERSCFLFHAL